MASGSLWYNRGVDSRRGKGMNVGQQVFSKLKEWVTQYGYPYPYLVMSDDTCVNLSNHESMNTFYKCLTIIHEGTAYQCDFVIESTMPVGEVLIIHPVSRKVWCKIK